MRSSIERGILKILELMRRELKGIRESIRLQETTEETQQVSSLLGQDLVVAPGPLN